MNKNFPIHKTINRKTKNQLFISGLPNLMKKTNKCIWSGKTRLKSTKVSNKIICLKWHHFDDVHSVMCILILESLHFYLTISTENGIIIYTHEYVSRTRAYN
ncbi:hypothetical protein BpHYR1_001174 [Brachionus plicatilis]|uniref:Uncharacterized protein n=1 Tax=Brachionus plicatilis TaxID=10195 RepID=A0A3M7RMH8_BRAPC|nr:hypothetical protein BpHYR1_001174 [Brachionus plicatilis]